MTLDDLELDGMLSQYSITVSPAAAVIILKIEILRHLCYRTKCTLLFHSLKGSSDSAKWSLEIFFTYSAELT